jgi:hypothetical protein
LFAATILNPKNASMKAGMATLNGFKSSMPMWQRAPALTLGL